MPTLDNATATIAKLIKLHSNAPIGDVHASGTVSVTCRRCRSTAYWRNIPWNVWEYYIGGYQVIKKWLSYREQQLLGRPIKPEEAREVMHTARRIAAIILLQPKLDENYRQVQEYPYDWSAATKGQNVENAVRGNDVTEPHR